MKPKNEKIKNVTVLGVRTGEETKIITTENYSIYTLLIEYESGNQEVVELAPSHSLRDADYYNKLVPYINRQTSSSPTQSNIVDELYKLKSLLDSGVIDQTLYEKQHSSLVKSLEIANGNTDLYQNNINIIRMKPRNFGDWKTKLYIDGQKQSLDLDENCSITLEPNHEYTIKFKQGGQESKAERLFVEAGSTYDICFERKLLNIKVDIIKR